jgi:hypothetical protein
MYKDYLKRLILEASKKSANASKKSTKIKLPTDAQASLGNGLCSNSGCG